MRPSELDLIMIFALMLTMASNIPSTHCITHLRQCRKYARRCSLLSLLYSKGSSSSHQTSKLGKLLWWVFERSTQVKHTWIKETKRTCLVGLDTSVTHERHITFSIKLILNQWNDDVHCESCVCYSAEQTYLQLSASAVWVCSVWAQSPAVGSALVLLKHLGRRARLIPEQFLLEKHAGHRPAYWSEERCHSADTSPRPLTLKQTAQLFSNLALKDSHLMVF